jgi:hypothetical protein
MCYSAMVEARKLARLGVNHINADAQRTLAS